MRRRFVSFILVLVAVWLGVGSAAAAPWAVGLWAEGVDLAPLALA